MKGLKFTQQTFFLVVLILILFGCGVNENENEDFENHNPITIRKGQVVTVARVNGINCQIKYDGVVNNSAKIFYTGLNGINNNAGLQIGYNYSLLFYGQYCFYPCTVSFFNNDYCILQLGKRIQ